MEWLLIDSIGPFFHGYTKKRINWSKIPFSHLETADGLKPDLIPIIQEEFTRFVHTAAAVGFNAMTLDDVAHLYAWAGYDPSLKAKIVQYQAWYQKLFAIATQAGLRIFLTTDIMYYTPELTRELGARTTALTQWWQQALSCLSRDFPELSGVIMRFGESDGMDVHQTFRSALVLRAPHQVRTFLGGILDLFERHDKLLIFRTWSVGAYPVGDLMWHPRTFDRAFRPLSSPQLILSMKYGETDFFRFLPLNPLFYRGPQRKLIEFQARREYEGFGEFPAFTG
jgi:alpha-glucuronidase